jgi:hypothetical protein
VSSVLAVSGAPPALGALSHAHHALISHLYCSARPGRLGGVAAESWMSPLGLCKPAAAASGGSWLWASRRVSTTPGSSQSGAGGGAGGGARHVDDDFDRHHRVNDQIFSRALRVMMPDGQHKVMSRCDVNMACADMRAATRC